MSAYRQGQTQDMFFTDPNIVCIECGERMWVEGDTPTIKTSGGYFRGPESAELFLCSHCAVYGELHSIGYVIGDAFLATRPKITVTGKHQNPPWWVPGGVFKVIQNIEKWALYAIASGLFWTLRQNGETK